jgi:hypothetical protein
LSKGGAAKPLPEPVEGNHATPGFDTLSQDRPFGKLRMT